MGYLPYIVAFVVYSLAAGVLTRRLAETKGYDGYFWTGFFWNALGLIYVVGLPLSKAIQLEKNNDLAKRISEKIK